MQHDLHPAECPCSRCEPPRHPSEYRTALRGILNAVPLTLLIWIVLLVGLQAARALISQAIVN